MSHDAEHRIRERAYHLWEAAGRPHGRGHEFWEEAVRLEHEAAATPPAKQPARANAKPAKLPEPQPPPVKAKKGKAAEPAPEPPKPKRATRSK